LYIPNICASTLGGAIFIDTTRSSRKTTAGAPSMALAIGHEKLSKAR
jgi:hypothetical protein